MVHRNKIPRLVCSHNYAVSVNNLAPRGLLHDFSEAVVVRVTPVVSAMHNLDIGEAKDEHADSHKDCHRHRVQTFMKEALHLYHLAFASRQDPSEPE